MSKSLGDLIQEALGIFPAQAGVGDGFAIAVFADLLASWFNVAFNHDTLDKVMDVRGMAAAVQNLLDDADLLGILLVGIGMIGVHNAGGILQVPLRIQTVEQDQVLIVIIGQALSMLVDGAAQDCVGPGMTDRSPLVGFFMPTGT